MNVLKRIWAHFIKSHHHWEDLQNRLFDPDLGRPCQLLAKIKFTFQLCCQYNCTCQSIIMFYQIYKLNIIVKIEFSNFSCMFLNPIFFFLNLNSNCSNLLDLRNLQEQVKKAFCYRKFFWPLTVWINCSSDLKKIANSVLNFQSFFLGH